MGQICVPSLQPPSHRVFLQKEWKTRLGASRRHRAVHDRYESDPKLQNCIVSKMILITKYGFLTLFLFLSAQMKGFHCFFLMLFLTRLCLAPTYSARDGGHVCRFGPLQFPVHSGDDHKLQSMIIQLDCLSCQFLFQKIFLMAQAFGADCVYVSSLPLLDCDVPWAVCVPCEAHGKRQRPFLFLPPRHVTHLLSNKTYHIYAGH
jgi:hypothetical protein